ncbi:MAG: RHS repeat-associated core domain-containing protein [Deltaproteobacteria bacterium]|nr:RHS repeat-associated core domain-containing protein [Deltaproteobacteria bacterium]
MPRVSAGEQLAEGDQRRTTLNPDGTQTQLTIGVDGGRTITAADATVQTSAIGPDPRFGLQAPITTKSTVTTPGGTAATVTGARSVSSYAGNPLVFGNQTDTTTINSRPPSTSTYNSATRVTTDTSPAGRTTQTTVDTKGRVTRVQATGLHPLRIGYDGEGRPTTMKYGPENPETLETRTSSIEYVTDFDTVDFPGLYPPAAKGQVKSTTDAAGRKTLFEYDPQGRVSAQLLPDEPPLFRRVEFHYDPAGNVTSITPPGRPAHGFGYTPVNLEERYTPPQVTPPLAVVETTYSYTADRQLDLVTRPDGGTIDYAYDHAGRLDTLTLDPADGPTEVHQYVYDDLGSAGDDTGNLARIVTPEATLEFSYDGGLPTGETWSGAGLATASVTQHYDTSFRRDAQQLAVWTTTQPAISFGYDNDDLLTQAGALTLTRDPANGLLRGTSITSGSGTITDTIDYGTGAHFGEVAHYTAKFNGTPFFERAYTRDALGRITSVAETITLPPAPPATTTTYYTYDDAGRLFQVCPDEECDTPNAEYHYDANGNRIAPTSTTQGNVSANYDAQDRLLSMTVGPAVTTYEYTANGELWKKTEGSAVTTYAYDGLGNLRHVDLPDGTAIDYVVDGRNRRIAKKVDGTLAQQWLYQDQLEPVAELNGSGDVVAEFVYGSKAHVPDYILKGGQTYRVVTDHLGSVRLVVNVFNANVAQQMAYDAFGRTLLDTNPGWQPFGYAGGIYDSDDSASLVPGTGLLSFGARDYQPTTGRWIQKDPIRFLSGETNLYAYVFGNPIERIDVTGLSSFDLNDLGNTLSEEERMAGTQRYSLGNFLRLFNYNKGPGYQGGATHFFSAVENKAIKDLFGTGIKDAALQLHLIEQGILPPITGLSKTTLYIYRLIAVAALTGQAGDPVSTQITRLKVIDALLRAM